MKKPVHFPPKDLPLRDDVRILGALLGDVLKERGEDGLYEKVESVRLASRKRREGDPDAEETLVGQLSALDADTAGELVRAFSAYFGLVNVAERVHRIRRRRTRMIKDGGIQPGNFLSVFRSLKENGVTRDQLLEALHKIRIEPVFTAHPTECTRPIMLRKEKSLADKLVAGPERTEYAAHPLLSEIQDDISITWQTQEQLSMAPTVPEEAENIIYYLSEVLFEMVPDFYDAIADALREVYGDGDEQELPEDMLRFGSWAGGDMDGNPNVSPDTLRAVLRRQREVISNRYLQKLEDLGEILTHSESRSSFSPDLRKQIEEYATRYPERGAQIPSRFRHMPYRMMLHFMIHRMKSLDYPEFRRDLWLITQSLKGNSGYRQVRRLCRQFETFGFHLASMEVRQNASVLREAVGTILDDPDFPRRSSQERTTILNKAMEKIIPMEERTGPLEVLKAIDDLTQEYGALGVCSYIISMTGGPDDVLCALFLVKTAGLDQSFCANIIPLFETVDDLTSAQGTMEELFQNRHYGEFIADYAHGQIVMLGYSDSSKDGGVPASRWALFRAQEALSGLSIPITFFHGRGGSVSRGGGKPREAILASPPQSVTGRIRLTEQGEIIHAKYGMHDLALRTTELMSGAVLKMLLGAGPSYQSHPEWIRTMDGISQSSRTAYKKLVHEDPAFPLYFRTVTPIDVIERLRIGSRPPSRKKGGEIRDLRAIPWVFAWTQSRFLLPGWYGTGTALEKVNDQKVLQEMLHEWPFFSSLVSDVEMVLAKADMGIAARYAALAGEEGKPLWNRIHDEFKRTRDQICQLRECGELLDREPVLQRTIRVRNPYVDPMSLLQIELLQRWREGDRKDKALEEALFTTVRGIARGLQNTG